MSALKKVTMKEQIYAIIKERILNQTYAFGEKINMLELSQELGVSNSPIREALSLLESERLVTFIPNVGPSVVKVNHQMFEEATQTAVILLQGSYDQCLLLNRIPEVIAEMEACLQEQKKLVPDHSPESVHKFARLSIEFDFSVIKVLQNNTLDHLYQWFFNSLMLVVLFNHQQHATDREKNIAQHEAILDAIKHGTPEDVKKNFANHYNRHIEAE